MIRADSPWGLSNPPPKLSSPVVLMALLSSTQKFPWGELPFLPEEWTKVFSFKPSNGSNRWAHGIARKSSRCGFLPPVSFGSSFSWAMLQDGALGFPLPSALANRSNAMCHCNPPGKVPDHLPESNDGHPNPHPAALRSPQPPSQGTPLPAAPLPLFWGSLRPATHGPPGAVRPPLPRRLGPPHRLDVSSAGRPVGDRAILHGAQHCSPAHAWIDFTVTMLLPMHRLNQTEPHSNPIGLIHTRSINCPLGWSIVVNSGVAEF